MNDQHTVREPHVPPLAYLRKLERRLERLHDLGVHECIRPHGPRFPDPRTRREYMEVFDKLVGEDLPTLIEDLKGGVD